MASLFAGLLDWLRSLFFTKELEITIVGLQNSGKYYTSQDITRQCSHSTYNELPLRVPRAALWTCSPLGWSILRVHGSYSSQCRLVERRSDVDLYALGIQYEKGNKRRSNHETMGFALFLHSTFTNRRLTINVDIGGQPRFRSMWERYCRNVSAILFVVDSADSVAIDSSRLELHGLLDRPQLSSTPLLILGNKNDSPDAIKVGALIERLELSKITGREVSIYSISAKNQTNIDVTLTWLAKRA